MTVISKIISNAPKIKTAAKKLAGKPLGVTSKVLGIATIASVVYDSHVNGKEKAVSVDEKESGDKYFKEYKQYMSADKQSATLCLLKKMWFDAQQSYSYFHLGSRLKGYAGGFLNTVFSSLPLIGLSAAALKFKKAGKVAGILLAVDAAKTFLFDVVGIGSKKKIK